MNRGIVPHHFRCGTGNFQSALEKAGSMPRGPPADYGENANRNVNRYLDQRHLEWKPPDEDEGARALIGQALHTQAELFAEELCSQSGRLVGKGRGEDEVSLLQGLLCLLAEALRLLVLRATVGAQARVIHAAQITRRPRQQVANV